LLAGFTSFWKETDAAQNHTLKPTGKKSGCFWFSLIGVF